MINFELINDLTILILAVIIHEIGHILGFLYYKTKFPPIKLTWWGIQIGTEKFVEKYTPRQMFIISGAGPIFGLCFLFVVPGITNNLILVYLLICFIDFFNMYGTYNLDKKFYDVIIGDLETVNKKWVIKERLWKLNGLMHKAA